MFLSNKYVHGDSEEQLEAVLRGVTIGFSLLVMLLAGFTWVRLRVPDGTNAADRGLRQWNQLADFPKQLFIWFVCCGILVSQLHQLSVHGLPPWPRENLFQYGKSTLFNLNTFVAIGMIHYSAARGILGPRLRQLSIYRREGSNFRSAGLVMIAFLACGLTYMVIRMLWYALGSEASGKGPQQAILLSVFAIVFGVTFAAVYYTAYYLFRDLDFMTAKLRELAQMKRGEQRGRVPIASPYESGQLTSAFNALQDRFEQEYARLDKDLDLAYRVQEQLLSSLMKDFREWKLDGSAGGQGEVGGSFYDALPLTDNRLALMAGTVTGYGLPSALVMSALVMLFRTTANAAADAGAILNGLNRTAADILQDGFDVHMTVAILDCGQEGLEYASAGNMLLQVDQAGSWLDDRAGTIPLGRDPDSRYQETKIHLLPGGCRIELYAEERSVLSARRGGGERVGA